MREPFRIFIGWDDREASAYHVLCHSIIRRASAPVSITPIRREHLPEFTRERGENESTDFSISRFLTPYLAGYKGMALFLDCDMLALADVCELLEFPEADPYRAVYVCKHEYTPRKRTKFLGHQQAAYPMKNWSSLMLFNLQHFDTHFLTPEYVNIATGMELHRFKWTRESAIGSIPLEWNYLVGEPNQSTKTPKVIHYTNGSPFMEGCEDCEYADLWRDELKHMTQGAPVLCAT